MRPVPPDPPLRTFRPTRPTFRELRPVLFFGLLTLASVVGWIRTGNAAPAIVGLALLSGATWLAYRGRVVGSPALTIDAEGVRFVRGRNETYARWSAIKQVSFGPYRRKEIWLERRRGPPIKIHSDMTTATGERFDMVFDDYLESARPARTRRARA